jgi:EAL domain-containing protein (putative c-di-GMP-specific phosphodiesterase class I)
MDNHELAPVYQPVTDLHTAGLVGASVSLRWARPDEIVLLSNEFLAEEGDLPLSAQVSAWMLDRAFSDLAAWQSARWLQSGFHLAIKVFAREVADPQFAETIEDLMEKHAIPATMLSIDLSPQAARQAVAANYALTRLSEVGISFTLDDFGSAEAGLSWLRDLPINTLKLDSHLVESLDAPDDRRGTALVRAVIALGHTLHLAIVAKGVRTPAQRASLLAMGCEFAQDTQFGRPGPPEHPWSPDEIPSLSPAAAGPPET